MKYVMLEDVNGRKIPIIFPDHLIHEDVAIVMAKLIMTRQDVLAAPFGAGFINLGTDVSVNGESETLNLKSRPMDAAYVIAGEAGQYMPEEMMFGLVARIKAREKK